MLPPSISQKLIINRGLRPISKLQNLEKCVEMRPFEQNLFSFLNVWNYFSQRRKFQFPVDIPHA